MGRVAMSWVKALSARGLGDSERKVVQVGGQKILLVNLKGKVYAVDSTCPHMGASLARGEVSDDGLITCPWHGSSFRLESGEVQSWTPRPPLVGRLLGLLRKKKQLRVYPAKVEGGSVWVDVEQ
jgi:nitrite reductase/ring-hydroxylating ferredoxin subunit